MPLEVCCFNLPSAIIALSSPHVSRIELCAFPSVGGTTPGLETYLELISHLPYIEAATPASTSVEQPSLTAIPRPIPINIMIRPRGGNFVYTPSEHTLMLSSIQSFLSSISILIPPNGFVFGCLTPQNTIDIPHCTALLSLARSLNPSIKFTFHRAFDLIPAEMMEAQLELLVELGFTAVLTSGGKGDAVKNTEMLRKLVMWAKGRVEVIVGGGVRGRNLGGLRGKVYGGEEEGGIGEEGWWHSSAIVDGGEMASGYEIEALGRVLGGAV